MSAQVANSPGNQLPKVYQLGEYEVQMDAQAMVHKAQLLTACDYDIEMAYGKWISMIKEMEAYANRINFDLNGAKVWLNVFFEAKGKIANIGFYLKPNSRNIDRDEFNAFLRSFTNQYTFPHIFSEPYSHYGSAGFPTSAYETPTKPAKVSAGNQ